METVVADPLFKKRKFAELRGWSTRTLERYVRDRRVPQGEVIDDHGTRAWRASLVNMTLKQLEELARAQPEGVHLERSERADHMREVGAQRERRKPGRPTKAEAEAA